MLRILQLLLLVLLASPFAILALPSPATTTGTIQLQDIKYQAAETRQRLFSQAQPSSPAPQNTSAMVLKQTAHVLHICWHAIGEVYFTPQDCQYYQTTTNGTRLHTKVTCQLDGSWERRVFSDAACTQEYSHGPWEQGTGKCGPFMGIELIFGGWWKRCVFPHSQDAK